MFNMKQFTILLWVIRITISLILLQTLFFKFTAAPESVFIFSKLGLEPWGRILIGTFELVASVMILIPRITSLGAFLSTGIMAGALFSHIFKLGIVVENDGGLLFGLALLVFILSSSLVFILRKQLLTFFKFR